MGRGKKKDKKAPASEVTELLETLAIGDTGASSQSNAPVATPEPTPVSAAVPQPAAAPPMEEPVKTPDPEEPASEDPAAEAKPEEGGLGVTKRKRPPRKRKGQEAKAQAGGTTGESAQPVPQGQPPQHITQPSPMQHVQQPGLHPQQPGGPPAHWQQPGPPQQQPGGLPPHWQQSGPPQQQPGGPPAHWQQPGPPQQQPGGLPPHWHQPGPPQQQPGGLPPHWQQSGPPQQQPGGPPAHWQQPGPPQQQPGGLPPHWHQPGPPQQQPGGLPPHWQQPGPPQQQPGGHPAQWQQPGPPQHQPGGPPAPSQQPGTPQQPRGPPQQSQQPGPPLQQPAQSSQPKRQSAPTQQHSAASGEPARPTQSAPDQRRQPAGTVKCRFAIPSKVPPSGRIASRPVRMITNYLGMAIKPLKVHRYDATITPERPKKLVPKVFQACMEKHFPKFIVAFDQFKNFYSIQPLPKVSATDKFETTVEITDSNDKKMKFNISFKATGIVDLNTLIQYMKSGGTSLYPPTEAIQCVDVILRQGTLQSYIKAGRQFFKRPDNPIVLGDGMEMWTGLFQSAIFTSRSFVNIDVAHKGFPIHQPLIQMLRSVRLEPSQPVTSQRGRGVDTFLAFIKGLKVMARLGGNQAVKREYIVNRLVDSADAQMFTFTDEGGKTRKMSVAHYFMMKGIRLQFPKQNCVWVGPTDKSIYYPMEILDVSYGQVRNRQLNEMQLSTMVREAATPPNVRKKKIEEVIRDMKYNTNPYFEHFGLKISDQFTPIEGRVLNAPKMEYGGRTPVTPSKGAWQADRLLQGMELKTWGVIAVELDPAGSNAEALIQQIKNTGTQMGMRVGPPEKPLFNIALRDLERIMSKAVERGFQMLIVIVNSRNKDAYSQVKKIAEKKVGLLTQCIKDQTATRRLSPQTVRNILLKVNSKLMGINHAIEKSSVPACMEQNIMVVGADVTHPSPDQTSVPSIAAVTASIDKKCFKYNLEFSIQTPKLEMIVQFEDMMVDHLQLYRKEMRTLPSKIYVFRDGVSEGQFAQVMNCELQAVYNAYARLSGGKGKPEVMFLLVQKRHHTRFFLGDSAYNVEPGTVVDNLIVHPSELDFYLVSHQAIKGTARPTRYHAVCNDGRMPADEVEQLTYYLCHLYSRCSRAVSYPTPTYYAHLACLRARVLTLNEKYDNQALEKNPIRFKILPRVQEASPMFFV